MEERENQTKPLNPDDGARLATTAAHPASSSAPAPSARHALSGRRKLFAIACAVVSVALIAVSACFLLVPGTVDADSALKTTGSPDAPTSRVDDAVEQPEGSESAVEDEGAETVEKTDEGSVPPAASDTGSAASGSAPTPAPNSSGSLGEPSAPSGSGQQQPETVTVSVTVSSSAADGRVSGAANPTFASGATVYDALMATGLSVNAENTPYGIYVTAIGGLAQKEFGGDSGWKYSVNGAVPMASCSSYVLEDGDSVTWYYYVG